VLDVLKNDILTRFTQQSIIKTIEDFKVELIDDPAQTIPVVNKKLQFTAPPTGGLVVYKYTYIAESLPSTGYIYIYVAELDDSRTLLCDGDPYELKVKPLPAGVVFEYYESDSTTVITGNPTFTASTLKPDTSFYVKPKTLVASVPTAGTSIGAYMPKKRVDFKVTTTAGSGPTMRWTGLADTNWNNPANWLEVGANGSTSTVTYYPNACVNVEIPAGAPNYPKLTAGAGCYTITMGDRAMIAGIHLLTYNDAKVELKLNPDEKDRFVMWSAPLKSMYSGDYHFKDGGNPKFGDVYMNLFQQAKPGGSAPAAANTFTATFGHLGVQLPLGLAFNLKVTSTAANSGKAFTFPQPDNKYTDVDGQDYPATGTLSRTNRNKFIIDMDDSSAPGSPYATLPVINDVAGNTLIQVVNPYMAYLEVYQFINNNSTTISNAGYAIWDGDTNGFSQSGVIGSPDNRYQITTTPTMTTSGFIPPLQSFFVQKKTDALLPSVTVNALWAYTDQGSPYKLRADAPETNVLRIKATQDNGKQVSYAVLHYNESTSPDYKSSEDMHKLFYQLEEDVIPLEVYTFAPTREVLAINSSSDFSQEIPLGLRTDKAGQVTLEFTGMATFGHDVYLIDHAQNDKVTDLQDNPTYTFVVTKNSASDKVIELNNRFSLRTTYTGVGLGNEGISTTGLNVSSRDGYIYVQTPSPASSLQVYNAAGALVYSSTARLDYFRIRTDSQQAYIVKVKIGEEYLTQKIFVK
jgi:hypothetical protein